VPQNRGGSLGPEGKGGGKAVGKRNEELDETKKNTKFIFRKAFTNLHRTWATKGANRGGNSDCPLEAEVVGGETEGLRKSKW